MVVWCCGSRWSRWSRQCRCPSSRRHAGWLARCALVVVCGTPVGCAGPALGCLGTIPAPSKNERLGSVHPKAQSPKANSLVGHGRLFLGNGQVVSSRRRPLPGGSAVPGCFPQCPLYSFFRTLGSRPSKTYHILHFLGCVVHHRLSFQSIFYFIFIFAFLLVE